MRRFGLITTILFFCSFSIFAANLSKGTKVYKKPSFRSKVVAVLKKSMNVRLSKTKVKNWFKISTPKYKGYVNLGGGAGKSSSSSGAGRKKSSSRGGGSYSGGSKKGTGTSGASGSSSGKSGISASRGRKDGSSSSGGSRRRGKSSRGGSARRADSRGSGAPKRLSKKEQLKLEHDAAKMRAEANNQEFCSQCWYAKKGANPERFENTHPTVVNGVIVPGTPAEGGDNTVVK